MVRWAGWLVQGCLERDEGRRGDPQSISALCLGTRGSWTGMTSRETERSARSRLYSALERRKRRLHGGEAAFQPWQKFSCIKPRRGERLREGKGRQEEGRQKCS